MTHVRERALQLCLALCVVVGSARAGTVTLADQGASPVTVRKKPSNDSLAVGQLKAGEQAELIDEVPYWYKVRLPDGTEGYASKAKTVASEESAAPSGPTPGSESAHDETPAGTGSHGDGNGVVTVKQVFRVSDLSTAPPAPGTYRIHLIDVGTGMSVLVQGADFNLLFDGGSRDEKRKISGSGNGNRLLSYLYAVLGPSGPPECVPEGDDWGAPGTGERTINHLVLSHPHEDHNSLLPDVLHCYHVENVWESGINSPTGTQGAFVQAAVDEPGVHYHTAAEDSHGLEVEIGDKVVSIPAGLERDTFGRGDQEPLGVGAKFIIVHADPVQHGTDFNLNSIVLRVELGKRTLLLTGDTESGDRRPPSAAPARAEQEMLETDPALLDADILQVAHHGSKTSSRRAFLDAVSPLWALVSSGPFKYSGVKLPDPEILEELRKVGAVVLATDVNDGRCPVEDRIGLDSAKAPGGCDNYVLEIRP